MKLIIDIPEWKYKSICEGVEASKRCGVVGIDPDIHKAIYNGTPLSKGHGRILDEKDILDTENNDGGWYDLVDMPEYIAGVKAIIEADTESEEKYHA